MIPGAIAFTRTPCCAPWIAPHCARPTTACFETWYGTMSAAPSSPASDAVTTIAPPLPCRSYWRKAARSPRKTPRTLTAITWSKSAASISGIGTGVPAIPALR